MRKRYRNNSAKTVSTCLPKLTSTACFVRVHKNKKQNVKLIKKILVLKNTKNNKRYVRVINIYLLIMFIAILALTTISITNYVNFCNGLDCVALPYTDADVFCSEPFKLDNRLHSARDYAMKSIYQKFNIETTEQDEYGNSIILNKIKSLHLKRAIGNCENNNYKVLQLETEISDGKRAYLNLIKDIDNIMRDYCPKHK